MSFKEKEKLEEKAKFSHKRKRYKRAKSIKRKIRKIDSEDERIMEKNPETAENFNIKNS